MKIKIKKIRLVLIPIILLISILFLFILSSGCSITEKRYIWQGMYFKTGLHSPWKSPATEKDNLNPLFSPNFSSLDECIRWGKNQLEIYKEHKEGFFDCGTNCRYDAEYYDILCATTDYRESR